MEGRPSKARGYGLRRFSRSRRSGFGLHVRCWLNLKFNRLIFSDRYLEDKGEARECLNLRTIRCGALPFYRFHPKITMIATIITRIANTMTVRKVRQNLIPS